MIRKIGAVLAAIIFSVLFLIGCLCIAWPLVAESTQSHESETVIAEFQTIAEEAAEEIDLESEETEANGSADEETEAEVEAGTNAATATESKTAYADLLSAMRAYNQEIYENGQSGLVDAWSFQDSAFDLSDYGVETEIIGYVTIPSMDSELPIYLGATSANMRKGAVNLGQTSLPIGGENTNCVLAAHRGYSGIAFWRDIEKISIGDYVYVTNLWEELTYQVYSIEIIYPDDIDKILIQEGRDLLTLVTCHPYGGNGIYRYVVYCERVETQVTEPEPDSKTEESGSAVVELEITETAAETETQSDGSIITPDDYTFESSEDRIEAELALQKIGIALVAAMLAGILIAVIRWVRTGNRPRGKHERRKSS